MCRRSWGNLLGIVLGISLLITGMSGCKHEQIVEQPTLPIPAKAASAPMPDVTPAPVKTVSPRVEKHQQPQHVQRRGTPVPAQPVQFKPASRLTQAVGSTSTTTTKPNTAVPEATEKEHQATTISESGASIAEQLPDCCQ